MAKVSKELLKRWEERTRWVAESTLTMPVSEGEKMSILSVVEKDYLKWVNKFFPHYAKCESANFHKQIADALMKNKKICLLNEIFRSGGKSVHVDIFLPLYLYLVHKDLFFMLLIGETEPKACRLLSDLQAELQYNELLKTFYGNRFQSGSWADGDFVTIDGVQFMALGFGQNPRGARKGDKRPDYITVDDVDNKRHVNNDALMRQAVDYITEDIWGLFDARDGSTERFVFSNNNFHKNSITNRLKIYFTEAIAKQKELNEETDRLFKVITVTAVKDIVNFSSNWPQKTSDKYWRDKYNSMPYRSFMREYMHTHIQDGAIFKYDDILYKEALPLKNYEALCIYGDLSYKANADFKALLLVGKMGKEFHIIHAYVRQKSRRDVARWLYDMYEKHFYGRVNIRYMIEGLFAMDEFVSDFDTEGEERGYYIPVIADKSRKGDKFDRIESISGFFERQNVYFNSKHLNSDMQTLIDQFLAFEKGSKAHDDGPDAAHGAFNYLNMRTRKQKTSYAVGKRQNQHY